MFLSEGGNDKLPPCSLGEVRDVSIFGGLSSGFFQEEYTIAICAYGEAVRLEHRDTRELLEERLNAGSLVPARDAVEIVHRDGDIRLDRTDDRRRLIGINREKSSDGNERDIEVFQLLEFFRREIPSEIAEMRHADALEIDNVDFIGTAEFPALIVMTRIEYFNGNINRAT